MPESQLPEGFDIAEWTRRSREGQGLPASITDAVVLSKIATLVRAPVASTPSTPRVRRSDRTHAVRVQSGQSQPAQ